MKVVGGSDGDGAAEGEKKKPPEGGGGGDGEVKSEKKIKTGSQLQILELMLVSE